MASFAATYITKKPALARVGCELDTGKLDVNLVGKQLEVCWKYFHKDTKEPMLIWATGRVTRVADGLTNRRSSRAKKILPAGAMLWAWDADPEFGESAGEKWLALLPNKWNPPRQLLYGWRYAGGSAVRPARVRRCADSA